jgi:tRNA A37 threonylcarbamoyladenosine synthetase subunit TsaC/SUA5/YrdC
VAPLHGPPENVPAAAGGATLAVRVPAHDRLRDLLRSVRSPWTATSANSAGDPPILRPKDLESLLEPLLITAPAAVIDDGELPGGPPSTLVAWDESAGAFQVLRAGRFEMGERLPTMSPTSHTTRHTTDSNGMKAR